MPLKSIPIRKAVSFREEIHTGNSPIKVIADDYLMYAVKHSRNKNPATDIINEVLAHYFLKSWRIPTPNAALFNIDPKNLLTEYSNNHKPLYYKRPVFGSEWIEAVDMTEFNSIDGQVDYRKYENPEIIFTIGLFDIWIENDDRKPSNPNLLLQTINGRRRIIPIDHSYIFSTMNYKDLNPSEFIPIGNDNIFESNMCQSLKSFKKKRRWKSTDRENFYIYIQRCKQNYSQIIKQLPDSWGFTTEHKAKLYDFLFDADRNKEVFQEYAYKMK